MNIINKNFGKNLQRIRQSKKITQEVLAQMVSVDIRQICRLECGTSFVSCNTLYKICLTLNIKPSALFDFEIKQ